MKYWTRPSPQLMSLLMFIILTGYHNWGGAQVSLPTMGTAYFQDFNTLATSGTSSTLPTGWAFSEAGANANTTYTANSGSSNAGDTYSYGTGTTTERALGGLRSGNLIPTIGASFMNNTGSSIGSLMISYKGEQWRLGFSDVDRVDRLDFQYSTNATSLTSGTYTDFNALDFTSPITVGTVGALNGDFPPNIVVLNSTIGSLSIATGSTFWIRWLDFDATNADDGEAVDSFTIIPCPAVLCPANISVCVNAAPINLTGGTPTGGTYTGTGVSMNVFTPANAGVGVHTITYTKITGLCTGSCTFTITVNALPTVATGSYGPACTNDPNINLNMGTPPGGVWTGIGVVNGNQFDPNAGTQTIHYTVTNSNGCSSSASTVITVNPCLMAPEMRWVLLQNGETHGSCVSSSGCPGSICLGLQYTPSMTGTMTSYTTTFLFNCFNGGADPVQGNASCVLGNNSTKIDDCSGSGQILWKFLGASPPTSPVTNGVPTIVHQVCFTVPANPVNITQFTGFSVALNLPGGGFFTDAPTYTTFTLDGSLYCTLLPVKYLQFDADKFGDLTTRLDWVTAEEINNDYFEVQRSNNVSEEFETIGRVEAAENPRAVNPYQFYDYAAKPGVNYYRLKQYDNDGQFAYSPIRAVSFRTTDFAVKAFPNPVDNVLNVFISHADQSGRMELVDLAGRHILQQEFDKGDSNNELDVDGLTPGVYTLLVITGTEQYVNKIVVLE